MTKSEKKKLARLSKMIHGWRLCPVGEHWVSTHPLHVPSSQSHPEGSVTTRHGHCAKNPSVKDQLYPDEINEIAKTHFSNLVKLPCTIDLDLKNRGDQYDDIIAGWTQYWNEVLIPRTPLEPNLVKALIGSESIFNPTVLAKKSDPNSARGLMQIKNSDRKNLGNEKGELKDHYVTVTREELNDPNLNICAGIRWLFQKQRLASFKLGHDATWEETVEYYKGLRNKSKSEKSRIMKKFYKNQKLLAECKK